MPTMRSLALLALVSATATAQAPDPTNGCGDGWHGWPRGHHVCEVRDVIVPSAGALSVDASPNGGIHVTGSDRGDVAVRAVVHAWGRDEDDARALAAKVVVHTDGKIRAEGPSQFGRTGWSVDYEISAPRKTDLDLESNNGGIRIEHVRGNLDFDTTNGGLHLEDVAGSVRGHTTNGGVDVTLTGTRWDGKALDVRTTNGGVRLRVPKGYSARLEARTVNGGLNVDFPVTVQGRIGHEISATLGDGGALVRAETTNGGVHVSSY
jgi:DUF4097 and DUF4098 domain-containing protein YvlB